MAINLRNGPYVDLSAAGGGRGGRGGIRLLSAVPPGGAAVAPNVDVTNGDPRDQPPAAPPTAPPPSGPVQGPPNTPPLYVEALPATGTPGQIVSHRPAGSTRAQDYIWNPDKGAENPPGPDGISYGHVGAWEPKGPAYDSRDFDPGSGGAAARADSPAQTVAANASATSAGAAVQNADTAAKAADDRAKNDQLDRDFNEKKDALDRKEREARNNEAQARDARDFAAAEKWKQVAEDARKETLELEKWYRGEQVKIQWANTSGRMPDGTSTMAREFGEADSRRADVTTNLARQNQAYSQFDKDRQFTADLFQNPESYIAAAYMAAGQTPPAGTTMGEQLAKLNASRPMSVDDFLSSPAGGGPAAPANPATSGGNPASSAPGAPASQAGPAWYDGMDMAAMEAAMRADPQLATSVAPAVLARFNNQFLMDLGAPALSRLSPDRIAGTGAFAGSGFAPDVQQWIASQSQQPAAAPVPAAPGDMAPKPSGIDLSGTPQPRMLETPGTGSSGAGGMGSWNQIAAQHPGQTGEQVAAAARGLPAGSRVDVETGRPVPTPIPQNMGQTNVFGNPTRGERQGGAVTTGYALPPNPGGFTVAGPRDTYSGPAALAPGAGGALRPPQISVKEAPGVAPAPATAGQQPLSMQNDGRNLTNLRGIGAITPQLNQALTPFGSGPGQRQRNAIGGYAWKNQGGLSPLSQQTLNGLSSSERTALGATAAYTGGGQYAKGNYFGDIARRNGQRLV